MVVLGLRFNRGREGRRSCEEPETKLDIVVMVRTLESVGRTLDTLFGLGTTVQVETVCCWKVGL